ncbi:hypothetical protein [Kroppenstedtia sanguinis]|uniref:hypothetical protein n=1 Tax=Kroppenstedtia sanguinis TaxID=1380684 RepID=UPI0036D2911E
MCCHSETWERKRPWRDLYPRCKATFAPWALQFEIKDAPQALHSRWAEALE